MWFVLLVKCIPVDSSGFMRQCFEKSAFWISAVNPIQWWREFYLCETEQQHRSRNNNLVIVYQTLLLEYCSSSLLWRTEYITSTVECSPVSKNNLHLRRIWGCLTPYLPPSRARQYPPGWRWFQADRAPDRPSHHPVPLTLLHPGCWCRWTSSSPPAA